MSKKRLLSRAEVDVDVWQERDRLSIVIRDKKTGQRTIAEWWDDDARQMFEDGFFRRGVELKRSVIAYAEEMGLLAPPGGVRPNGFFSGLLGKVKQGVKDGKMADAIHHHRMRAVESQDPSTAAYHRGKADAGAEMAAGMYAENPGGSGVRKNIFTFNNGPRKNIFTFNNPPSGPANNDSARELELFIENDADLYRQQYTPIIKNLMLKRRRGVYNSELAVKLFMYLVDSGAKKYIREYVQSSTPGSTPPNIDTVFNKNTRLQVARSLRDSFEGEADLGNYDHMIVRPTKRGLKAAISRRGASSEFEMDMGMYEKGYRYKLIPKSKSFDPLYAKTMIDAAAIMREYKGEIFDTVDLRPPTSAHENPRPVRRGEDTVRCSCGNTVSLDDGDAECEKCGQWYNSFGQRLKDPSQWSGVRDYEDTLDNPAGAPNMVWTAYLQIALRRIYRVSAPRRISVLPGWISIQTGTRLVIDALRKKFGPMDYNDPRVQTVIQSAKSMELVKSNPASARKNIFNFNNPARKLNEMEQAAVAVGLSVTTWAPGDGMTRYRFFKKSPGTPYSDYHQGGALYTATGRKDAMAFIEAYGKGRSARTNPSSVVRTYKVPRGHEGSVARMLRDAFIFAQARDGEVLTMARPEILKRAVEYVRKHGYPMKNPLTRSEAGYLLKHARADVLEAGSARRHGLVGEQKYHTGRARGLGFAVQETGPKAARKAWVAMHTTLDRVLRNPPVCDNPIVRGDKLPEHLKREVLNSFIYRWTTGNTRREDVWKKIKGQPRIPLISDEQWLREHAFHVMKDGRLSLRHHHAEPHYMADDWKKGDPLPNPLLQTVMLANPPISQQWDRMTQRQRLAVLEMVGYPENFSVSYSAFPWVTLNASAKRALERQWLDTTTSRRGTTRRRVPVAVNPLTRDESARVLKRANNNLRFAEAFQHGHTRSEKSGQAFARGMVVKQYGPKDARRAAGNIITRAQKVVGTTMSNPGISGIRFPKPGTKLTVAQAMDLARRIGDRELIRQCQEAMKLQKKANRGAKCVIWKTLPIGSPNKIDMVTAFAHYGDSPETMYKPPKGSKKGPHMYRHKWGEGSGQKKSVPILAAPGGKALITLMGPGQNTGDWMRG